LTLDGAPATRILRPREARHMHARNAVLTLLASGLVGCSSMPEPAVGLPSRQAVYCYRSLADVDCQLRRDRVLEVALVGVYTRTAPPDDLPMEPMPPLP
jgi:hypothetical protein